jgi:hypothetical protein
LLFAFLKPFPIPDRGFDTCLQNFRSQRNNLQEFLFAQFTGDWPENARPYWLAGIVDEHRCILVEADVSAVAPAMLLASTYDYGFHHFSFLYLAIRRSLFYAGGDYIAESCIQSRGTAERQNHLQFPRAGVVGDLEHASHHHGHNQISLYARRSIIGCR